MQLAKSKSFEEQFRRLQEEKQKLLEEIKSQAIHISFRVAGGDDSERLREEIEDLKDDMIRKDLSIKNMDVLLKGLLTENERLKSRQAQSEEIITASVKREKELEDKVLKAFTKAPLCKGQ